MMRRHLPLFLLLSLMLAPANAFGVAFEQHTSWHKEPRLEAEKGVSLGKAVLEMGTGFSYLHSDSFFNSNGNLDTAPAEYDVTTWDLFWRFGFTENWTLWGNMPIVWSEQLNTSRSKSADGKLGDTETGIIYQFFRRNNPTISMGASLRWKLPTGSEIVGTNNLNITGTGTTDVELAYIGRWQFWKYISLAWSAGYNIRLPGPVQYILDRNSSITNAWLDLGDEIHAELDVIGGIKYVSFQVNARFTYRMPSSLAIPEFRAETVRWTDPATGDEHSEEFLLFNGAEYHEWDTLSPIGQHTSSAGYMFTVTPKIIIRPLEWLDVVLFAQIHLAGKNSVYITNTDGNNSTIDNFMPMQTLGTQMGLVIGKVGVQTLVRW